MGQPIGSFGASFTIKVSNASCDGESASLIIALGILAVGLDVIVLRHWLFRVTHPT
jgi:hypothetical protein